MVSIWHVQYCQAGPGNVLFFRSNDLTAGECRIYSDNINLTRWIQEEITGPTAPWADNTLPVLEATFETDGDSRDFITESVTSGEGRHYLDLVRLPARIRRNRGAEPRAW